MKKAENISQIWNFKLQLLYDKKKIKLLEY